MPPEPLPWDRKDLLRDRKHERSESLGSFSRWREASHHGPPSREFGRWGSSEFRTRPPGHSKQGAWQVNSEEPDHVLTTPTRCNEKAVDEENSRLSGHNRGDGRHNRSSSSNRDNNNNNNRGSFSQKEYNNNNKGHSWEADVSPNGPGRLSHGMNIDQRSVDNMLMENSHPHSDDFVSSWDQFHLKEQHIDNRTGANGLDTGRKVDKESSLGSIEWKSSHKWTRSGSLSSRGSSFSQSGSSKSMGVDSSEAKNEVQIKALTPLQSPSGETGACVTSAAPFEDPNCRKKKPRLGWGEGLAKYEKKKVEGPEDIIVTKPALFVSTTDPLDPHMLDQSEKSPVVPSAVDPATPSSVGCSSSSGREDKPFTVMSNVENETGNLCSPTNIAMENHLEKLPFNLENLDLASISNLSTSLGELLQDESTSPADSSFVRCTAINKLLILKRDVSKELEITESEIDLLETELKCQSPPAATAAATASNSLLEHQETPCDDQLITSSNLILEDTFLNLVPSGQAEAAAGLEDGHGGSPGTITTNYTESSTEKADGQDEDLQTLGTGLVCASDVNTLVASNNDIAKNATQEIEMLCPPTGPSNVDPAKERSGVQNDDLMRIRDKIMERKHFMKFQESVVALKYRIFQRMWKEDMELLSVRKNRAKSQRRQELCLRTQNGIFQKHRSSTRVRFSSPAGSMSVVPSTEVINFTSKLLSDPQPKVYRNTLKMPSLILDKKERIATRFVSSNGLLEDPCGAEEERALINPWTIEERKIFTDKFAEFGKDFKKISSFLDHKTVAACVEFYYKNHKLAWFPKVNKNKPEFPAQGKSSASSNYLVTSGKQLNHERNASSLHMLGAVSALVANADNNGVDIQQKRPSSQQLLSKEASKSRGFDDRIEEGPGSPEILDNERETAAADVLAGICGSMSSCVTSSFTPGENHHRVLKSSSVTKQRPLTVEVMHSADDDDSCSDESSEEDDQSDWADVEKSAFMQAMSCYGKDFKMVSQQVRTKSKDECKMFFSKARKCLGLLNGVRSTSDEIIPMEEDEIKGQIVSDLNTLPCESSQAVVPEEENDEEQDLDHGCDGSLGNDHGNRQHEVVEAGNSETQVGNTKDSQKLQGQKGGVENGNCELNVSMKTDLNCVMDDDLSVIGGVLSHLDRDVSMQVDINNKQLQKKTDHGLELNKGKEPYIVTNLVRDNFLVVATNSVPSHQNKTFNPDLLSTRHQSNHADVGGGYPLLVRTNKRKRNDDLAASKNPILLQSSKLNGNHLHSSDKYLMQDCFLQKCTTSSKTLASVAELPPFPPPKQENVNHVSRKVVACDGSSSDLEKPPLRNGDIKLFGQILTHPSKHENEEKMARLNGIPFEFKSNAAPPLPPPPPPPPPPVVVDARPLKGKLIEGGKNYMGSENGSVRSSYSFLDGKRSQSGFSCLPDSAILLAKYPAAFVNLSSSSNIEQHTLPPFEPKNDLSSKGIVDYNHIYSRSQQQSGGSSRGENDILLNEMRMLNGYEAAPSTAQQQQPRIMMGGGGIIGGMNILSDPVAALKMHYGGAKEQQQNGHLGTHHTREEEPWRGNKGDIGR